MGRIAWQSSSPISAHPAFAFVLLFSTSLLAFANLRPQHCCQALSGFYCCLIQMTTMSSVHLPSSLINIIELSVICKLSASSSRHDISVNILNVCCLYPCSGILIVSGPLQEWLCSNSRSRLTIRSPANPANPKACQGPHCRSLQGSARSTHRGQSMCKRQWMHTYVVKNPR